MVLEAGEAVVGAGVGCFRGDFGVWAGAGAGAGAGFPGYARWAVLGAVGGLAGVIVMSGVLVVARR